MAAPAARMYPAQVHTRSMDIILAPIASRISQLLILCESASSVVSGTPPSGIQMKLSSLQAAMVELASAAERTVEQFSDDELSLELPQACKKTTQTGHKIVETASKLCSGVRSLNGDQLAFITASSQELMTVCFQVLVAWDAAEVRKIVDAANLLLDRLHLVEVSKSMRGLLICLKGFSEPLFVMLALLDKRIKELTSPDIKRNLLANLDDLKQCIPKLTASTQACIRNPHDDNAKHFCNFYVTEVERTVGEIIVIVQKSVPTMSTIVTPVKVVSEQQPLTRAATVERAQVQLRSSLRYSDSSDLEHNINAVLHNSMAVAHVSRDVLRNKITQLCTEVEILYKEFKQQREMLALNPTSAKLKVDCDGRAEVLSAKLLLLEKTVQEAVIDQISDAFVGTSDPLNHLITAAVASQSSSEDSEDDHDLSNKVILFKKHSRRLSQVAINAAEGATDPSVAQRIKHTADQVEKLAPQVASAALFAHNNPSDQHGQQHLSLVKDEWTAKVKQLTTAVDEVTDSQDLLVASEVMIREDMTRCRDAIQRGDLRDVQATVAAIERRCRRLMELAKNELKVTEDPMQSYALTTTISKMETALSHMSLTCATLLSNVHDVSAQKALAGSLKQLVTLTKELKQALAMKKATKSVATSTPLPVSRPVVSSRGTQYDMTTSHVMPQDTPYISMQSTISPIQHSSIRGHQKAPLQYSTPIERSLGPYSPATPSYVKTTALKRSSSYGEHSHGYSKSYVTGDAETQTALPRMRDQNLQTQVDHQVSYSAYPVMVDASSSTTNLFDQTHCTVALQTDTDLLTDASINIDPHGPYAAYVLPGQRLVSAVLGGDAEIAEEQISEVQSRVNKLVEMGHQIVTTCPEDGHLIREIRDTISSVNQLTKLLIAQAVDLLSDSQDLSKAEQLKETGREWADSVQALAAAVEKGSQPWGKPPSRLAAEAAKGGSQLEYEIKHVNHQTEQLVDVAMTTVQAIEADKKQHGADTTNHIQIVRVTASEIAKLAPVLIKTAREASSNRSSMESLNLISQEWATNAKLLVHSVDAITDPPTSTVDYLAISAKSGDPQLFADQVNNIQTLTATLQEIAHNATMGCSDPELIKIVTVTGHKIEKLSAQLVECAKEMTKASDATEHDTASEQFTLVKHKWNSNLQLLTTHVDDLISRMAAPLSKLVGIAVAISKTESETTKQHLMNQFAAISDHLSQHVGVLETTFDQTVLSVHKDSTVNSAGASIKILRKLTPHSIAAARSLTDDQSLAVVEHFQHLRRQWAAKAQSLYTQLISITSVDMTPVLAAFEDMIGVSLTNGTTSSPMPRAQSSADMYNASPAPRTRPYSQADTSEVVKRKSHSSTERPITIAVPQEATPSFNSITAAALNLHQEADQFMSEGNPIISTAKEMSDHMRHLAEYSKGRGIIETKEQMIDAAKEIASSARVIVDYAKKIAQQCTDSRMKYTLEQSAELIPTLGTQLTIIATVKASSAPSDISADVMLVKNAQNLMEAVIKTMREAEAACMKGLKPSDDPEDLEAVALALSWKKNLYHRRNMESVRAPVGKKGLRRIDKSASTSSMVDIIERARTSIGSPPKC